MTPRYAGIRTVKTPLGTVLTVSATGMLIRIKGCEPEADKILRACHTAFAGQGTLSNVFHPQRGDNLVQMKFLIDDNVLIYLA
ncbi:hypothetical protein MND13_14550 [Pantoea allii]|nr:hypothetical protein [Pantoea allii]MCH9298891.1 hypothetical protein [Pantoea allii]